MTPKECYLRAGLIHQEVCNKIKPFVKPGVSFLELARKIESDIAKYQDASLAFPVNIQINNEVHYSPLPYDTRVLTKDDLVKVDIGVHVNGYIADGAFTVTFDKKYQDMVDFTEKVLKKTLTGLKPGMKISEIGRRLDEQMQGSKYKIIRNLMGHQVQQWELHSTKSVLVYEDPNSMSTMEHGEAFAIEIFITDGNGFIRSSPKAVIYAMKHTLMPVRDVKVKKLCQQIHDKRKTFPFSERYVVEHLKYSKVDFFSLKQSGNMMSYPLLVERPGSKIAQFEDVIYIDKDDVIITTKQK